MKFAILTVNGTYFKPGAENRKCYCKKHRDNSSLLNTRMKRSAPTRDVSVKTLDMIHLHLLFISTSTGGMGPECLRFHSRLAELIANKKGEHYSMTISQIRARISFALLRSALICLRGSRTIPRRKMDLINADIDIQHSEAAIS